MVLFYSLMGASAILSLSLGLLAAYSGRTTIEPIEVDPVEEEETP